MATKVFDENGNHIYTETEDEAAHQAPLEEDDYGGARIQSMDKFKDEQKKQDEQLALKVHQNQTKKKTKPTLDKSDTTIDEAAKREIGSKNWVGLLIEYRNAHRLEDNTHGIDFVEIGNHDAHHPRFSCKVTIAEATDRSFGDVFLTNKKLAKQYAAKKAIDWLIANKLMPSDGSVKFPKQLSPNVTPQRTTRDPSSPPSDSDGNESPPPTIPWRTQVPALCHKLGFSTPQYEITSPSAGSPLCDIYADFSKDPEIGGRVGAVKNAYGKKNAKEECARLVVSFLKDIERQRLEQYAHEDQNRKRPLTSEGMAGARTIKVEPR